MKKNVLIRSGLALALAATLASCGGSSNFTIGGTVTGLQYGPLVLETNGMTKEVTPDPTSTEAAVKNVNYAFANQLEYGEVYDVTVKQQPPHQVCEPAGRTSDTAGRLSEIHADFRCFLLTPTIGGVVKGLAAGSVKLNNGSNSTITVTAANPAADVPYTLGTVTYGKTYGVTIETQPAGYTCTVANSVGIMGDVDITNIDVTCAANPT